MKVLVDFDNLPNTLRQQGAAHLSDVLLSKIGPLSRNCRNLEFRLYAGWDERGRMSTRAQRLSADIRATFPKIMKLTDSDPPRTVGLNMELAQSLEILPKKMLPNTSRTEHFAKEIKCLRPTEVACRNSSCPLDPIATFFNQGYCPAAGCRTTPNVLLTYLEQKLVDTMIVADLIHLSSSGNSQVAVVSSDDDMWPGILSALRAGAHVIHVQPSGTRESLPYLDKSYGKYTQVGL